MKKISLFLSVLAFVSFVAISPVSAGTPVATKKATTAQTAPATKKACCTDAKAGKCTGAMASKCTMGKDGKSCCAKKKTTAPVAMAK